MKWEATDAEAILSCGTVYSGGTLAVCSSEVRKVKVVTGSFNIGSGRPRAEMAWVQGDTYCEGVGVS